jgi:DNA adenine methylase
MILRRLGNKKRIAHKIIPHFSPHKIYIEPFFGAGGMFFSKPKAKYNIVNDLDSDVFNLFQVVMNRREELEKAFYLMPIHSDLLKYWKANREEEPIRKALRFLFLSNFTLLGTGNQLRFGGCNGNTNFKILFKNDLENVFKMIFDIQFNNCDFKDFLNVINYDSKIEKSGAFIYCDPPYLDTNNNYSDGFTPEQTSDLFQTLIETGCKFAVSEFDNPVILDLAKQHNLEVITIGERSNLKNRRTEVLIVNYESPNIYGLFGSNNANN